MIRPPVAGKPPADIIFDPTRNNYSNSSATCLIELLGELRIDYRSEELFLDYRLI